MKIKFHHIAILFLMLFSAACKLDNYAPPSVTLNGQLMYKGTPVNVEYNQVPFRLYQSGFKGNTPISGTFDQDGRYSVLTFAGNYKFTIPAGQGPFQWKELASGGRDSIAINLTGDQTVNIEVMPYYMVRSPQITAAGGKVSAIFNIEKVITDATAKDIERVNLYINKTQFVSGSDNINILPLSSDVLSGSSLTSLNNIMLSTTIPPLVPTQNYIYARIGVKISGVEDMVFSPVQKITF